ncbi:hypothetical protein NX722_25175 [Endozoicomonas gorgoniicola]|uniref:Uncharacterized protein n=1 Tax=Endozoicomonas gorgoniicola TaxID=1234144 RepID=A0ABT3N2K3_9GAMM|nr:hypothetical protein [Endozoicomonas gorgoniicola]MCW7555859.1 hypothetical protein [Endozoicomonas gorgoniicola]
MDSINRASQPIYHSEASTSAAYSESVSTPRLIPHKAIKRNLSSPIICDDQEEKPVKKRKVQLAEEPNTSEKKRQEANAKHPLESGILRTNKRDAVKYVEQWLNTKGVNTDSLKQEDKTADKTADKLAQYEKKLLDSKDNEIVNSCQDSLDELAKVLVDFNLENKLKKEQKQRKLKINIENINQLIQKTTKLKKHITVDEKIYVQLITLRNKISKQIYHDNDKERNKHYANALYNKAKLLMSESLPEKEFSELNENMDLLGIVAGTTPKPIRKKLKHSNKWSKEKQEKTQKAFSRLEKILQEKYKIRLNTRSEINLIYLAEKSIEQLKQHRELVAKTYIYKDLEKFANRSSRSEEIEGSNKGYAQKFRDKKNNSLMDLQELLGISLMNKNGNPDIEKTILAACEFFEEFEPDSHLPTSTLDAAEEELSADSIPASTSPRSEPLIFESKESTYSLKNTHDLRKELAYTELSETLKHWPALSTLPRDEKELICAAEYCINSIYWKEPITDEAYLKFRSSELASESHNDTPEESINAQLDSLKTKLIDASLHTEELSKKQGIEIIKAASEYLNSNEWHESDY